MSLLRWLAASLVLCGLALAQEKPPSQKEIDDLCRFVSKTRGLEYKSSVPAHVKTVADVKKLFEEEMAKTMPEEKLLGVQKTMVKLALIPPSYDLKSKIAEFYSQAVAAYYDPEQKELYVIDRAAVKEKSPLAAMNDMLMKMIGVKENLMICSHELTHALQDQNFDLTTMPMQQEDNDDEQTGVKSLVEGEANLVMYEYLSRKLNMDADGLFQMSGGQIFDSNQQSGSKEVDEAPMVLREGAMFPYTVGLRFVDEVRKKGGWEAVGKAFNDPPESTEQIIHPEKYLEERDNPIEVRLPDLKPKLSGWKELTHNVMGEFQMQVMFRTAMKGAMKRKEINACCSGWGGDSYVSYERPKDGRVLLVWATNWDDEEHAAGFAKAYRQLLSKKYGELSEVESNDTLYVADTKDAGRLGVERNGKDVLIIEGCDPDQGQALGQAVWKGLKKEEVKHLDRVKPKEGAKTTPKVETPRENPTEARRTTISGDGFSVSFEAPKGWLQDALAHSTEKGRRVEFELTRGEGESVIRVILVKGSADLADTRDETANRLLGSLQDGKVSHKSKDGDQVAGHDASAETLSGSVGDQEYRARVVAVGAEQGTITAILLGPSDRAEEDGKVFNALLNSLKVK